MRGRGCLRNSPPHPVPPECTSRALQGSPSWTPPEGPSEGPLVPCCQVTAPAVSSSTPETSQRCPSPGSAGPRTTSQVSGSRVHFILSRAGAPWGGSSEQSDLRLTNASLRPGTLNEEPTTEGARPPSTRAGQDLSGPPVHGDAGALPVPSNAFLAASLPLAQPLVSVTPLAGLSLCERASRSGAQGRGEF